MTDGGRAARGRRRVTAALSSLALVVQVAALTSLMLLGAPATANAANAAADQVSVTLSAASAPSLRPGVTYAITGTVTNSATAPVRSLTVRMRLAWERLDNAAIAEWIGRSTTDPAGVSWADTQIPTPLAPGGAVSFSVSGPVDALGLPVLDGFGPRGLAIEVLGDTGDGVQRLALVRTLAVWDPGGDIVETQLALLAPITPPTTSASTDAGVAGAEVIDEWGVDGRLSRIVRATADPAVGWAIDPSLLTAAALAQGLPSEALTSGASAAGTASNPVSPSASASDEPGSPAAPAVDPMTAATAQRWLTVLGAAGRDRDVYALPWGDPDLDGLAQAGAGPLLSAAQDDAVLAGRALFGRDLDHTVACRSAVRRTPPRSRCSAAPPGAPS